MRSSIGLAASLCFALCLASACATDASSAAEGTDDGSAQTSGAADESSGAVATTSEGDATTAVGESSTGESTTSTSTTETSTGESSTTGGGFPGFEPQDCPAVAPDPLVDRLCDEAADPEGAPDKIYIHCALEGACQGPIDPPAQDELLVMAFNIERGLQYDAIVAAFANGDLPAPDVLLLSEVDRGCARTAGRNVGWELAAELGMHHAYGVEFVELPRPDGSITAPCEHGNAILSRYPIGNVELMRHETNKSWYDTDEPRLGGRMALSADLLVGDRLVHVAALHFESAVEDGPIRAAQAAELADAVAAQPNPGIAGGDTNAGLYAVDLAFGTHTELTTEAFFDRGFVDAHITLDPFARTTHDPALVLDLEFLLGPTSQDPVVCPADVCDGLSDHRAVWATIVLP